VVSFLKQDFVFENIVNCTSKTSSTSQPEDGFRKKAETCSCDVLIIFLNIYFMQ